MIVYVDDFKQAGHPKASAQACDRIRTVQVYETFVDHSGWVPAIVIGPVERVNARDWSSGRSMRSIPFKKQRAFSDTMSQAIGACYVSSGTENSEGWYSASAPWAALAG